MFDDMAGVVTGVGAPLTGNDPKTLEGWDGAHPNPN